VGYELEKTILGQLAMASHQLAMANLQVISAQARYGESPARHGEIIGPDLN
jgi:hypothetical protein